MTLINLDKIDEDELKKAMEYLLEHSLNFGSVLVQVDNNVKEAIEIMEILYPDDEGVV